ncbi:MAG TPA: hypothetical protein VII82_12710 [Polyangiaceae bacterium]|jgi:hypothetical protein
MPSIDNGLFSRSRLFGLTTALVVVAACSSSSGGGATSTQPLAVSCASPGEATPGPADDHCTAGGMDIKQPTDQASCNVAGPADGGDDGANVDNATGGDAGDDASAVPLDGGPTGDCDPSEFGPAMYGTKGSDVTKGSDDDCKYDVQWTSTPICEGGNGVYFTVSATKRVDGTPLTGAMPYIESVQACSHPSPNPPPPAVNSTEEISPGTYKIGPIVFDRPGGWVVRFHFFGSCDDFLPTSPHGHAAFFVTVP